MAEVGELCTGDDYFLELLVLELLELLLELGVDEL